MSEVKRFKVDCGPAGFTGTEVVDARQYDEALRKAKREAWFNDFRPIINAIGEISVQEAMDAIESHL